MKNTSKLLAVALVAAMPAFAGSATAAPLGQPLAQNAVTSQGDAAATVQQVQFRRWGGGWRGGGWGRGWGWGPGLAAGAIIGGAIAASRPWGYGYYDPGYAYDSGYGYGSAYGYVEPGYTYGYSEPGYTYGGAGRDDAYCQQRYRSYDPSSGTYLGYDGVRHPCP
jgi:hypothetical protein